MGSRAGWLANGRVLRILTVEETYTWEGLVINGGHVPGTTVRR
jgi:hypothetical protein